MGLQQFLDSDVLALMLVVEEVEVYQTGFARLSHSLLQILSANTTLQSTRIIVVCLSSGR